MTKIVVTQKLHDAGMELLEKAEINVVVTNNGDPKAILHELKDADGVIIRVGSMDRETLEQCPKLKVIGRSAVGVDDIDVAAATQLGVPIVIAPGANTRSVAEHSMAMMFACAKDIRHLDASMRKGDYYSRYEYRAYELFDKTLGLVGYGRIGSDFAGMASAIGMKVIVYDPFIKRESVESQGYGYREDVHAILKEADVVSIHTPLTPQTQDMIDEAEFKMMKRTGILINCARGAVVNEAALDKALTEHWIQSAGLDVMVSEPNIDINDPLFKHDNLIITPHMAGQTKEAAAASAIMAVEGTLAVIRGEKWDKVCNPEAFDHRR